METMTRNPAREIVLSCIEALNKNDYNTARKYVGEDFKFDGVLGSRDGAEAYFKDMEKMKLKYDIQKVFANGDDVCLLYNLDLSGVNTFCCGWYQVKDGKINYLKVVFDPRAVLKASEKK